MNRLNVQTLTPELLAGPTFELMKGTCKSLTELEYFCEEVYKATTEKLDWINPEGRQYPHDLRQPPSLVLNSQGRRVIPFHHFINNDLEYLRGGVSSRKYSTSVTKTKAADYGHIKWIEDLVPNSMWSQTIVKYDRSALWGISHWGKKRRQFYAFATSRESARDVYSKRRIIAVTKVEIVEWHDYKHLDWITVRRDDDALYKFKEGDLHRLRIQDIEDMLLLLVQGKDCDEIPKDDMFLNLEVMEVRLRFSDPMIQTDRRDLPRISLVRGRSPLVVNLFTLIFTMKMEILLEPTSNKLMVEHAEYDESNTYVLERFNTSAGNPVKKILLKLNLSDHRLCKMVVEVPDSSWLTRSITTCSYPTDKHKVIMKAQMFVPAGSSSNVPADYVSADEKVYKNFYTLILLKFFITPPLAPLKWLLKFVPQPKNAEGAIKPKIQWTLDERKVVVQDQHLKSIIMSCILDDIMESVISCEIAKATWTELVHSFEGLRNANHTQTLDLADIYERFVYEDNLIQRRYLDSKKAVITTPSTTPISTAFFYNDVIQDFQENSDDEVDERTSEEYL
ncbi:hypothetical protein Tco_1514931 [Tanacetum coccineum]